MRRHKLAPLAILAWLGCSEPHRPRQPPPAVATITISPASISLLTAETVQLTVTATDAAGNAVANQHVVWSSSDSTIAAVTASGLLIALAPGTATITATIGAVQASRAVVVRRREHPAVGSYDVLMSFPRHSGRSDHDSIPWSQSAVLTISSASAPTGAATLSAVAFIADSTFAPDSSELWMTRITATDSVTLVLLNTNRFGGIWMYGALHPDGDIAGAVSYGQFPYRGGSGTFVAKRRAVPFLVATPKTTSLVVGMSRRLAAWAAITPGAPLSTKEPMSWRSRDASVATVDGDGVVHAIGPGTTTIVGSATARSLTDSAAVVVYAATPTSVSLASWQPDSGSMYVNARVQFLATVTWPTQLRYIGTQDVIWSSNDTSVATVTPHGLVEGVSPGRAVITAAVKLAPAVATRVAVTITSPPPSLTFAALAAGDGDTCGLVFGGGAYCWGFVFKWTYNYPSAPTRYGTLPVRLPSNVSFSALAAGSSCALDTNGTVWCWGNGSSTPTPVTTGIHFASLTTAFHTCGVAVSGQGYCWGSNYSGQLGDGTTMDRVGPTPVPGLQFAMLTAASNHTCGITADGRAYCWGWNGAGALGLGAPTFESVTVPSLVAGGFTWKQLSAGGAATCGITDAGVTMCWGSDYRGQGGHGTASYERVGSPRPVVGGLTFAVVSVGWDHTCGVTPAGAAYCWGGNDYGQVGDGTTIDRAAPVEVAGGLRFASIVAGSNHTCALTADGKAYCWGANINGQIGVGDRSGSSRTVPVAVVGPLP